MWIIAGYVTVEDGKQAEYVTAFQDMVQRARAFEGCLDLAITADPLDSTRVYNFELWDSQENLDKWRKVANAPSIGFEEANVKKYEISSVREPF